MAKKKSFITLTDQFCGAGGSSIGATLAGAELRLAMNYWKLVCAVNCLCSSSKNRDLPICLRLWAWAWGAQKTVVGGQNGCNITWGYVAWVAGKGWGGGVFGEKFWLCG